LIHTNRPAIVPKKYAEAVLEYAHSFLKIFEN